MICNYLQKKWKKLLTQNKFCGKVNPVRCGSNDAEAAWLDYKEYENNNFFYYNSGNVIEVCDEQEVINIIIPKNVIDKNIFHPIQNRINEVKPKYRDVPYCKIVGYIRNNRAKFDQTSLQQIYNMWLVVDKHRIKCGSFSNFLKTVSQQ